MLPYYFFFLAAFFFPALGAAAFFLGAFFLAAFFLPAGAVALGMARGLQTSERVVASLPQVSQKYFSSTCLGKQICRGLSSAFPQ